MIRTAFLALVLSSSIASADDTCAQVFRQQRTCTDKYIPALVDLRAKLDLPAGIKSKVASHRDDVIAQAKDEWKKDSTDDAIAATCKKIPADAPVADAKACLAKTGCDAFVACIIPVTEKMMKQMHK